MARASMSIYAFKSCTGLCRGASAVAVYRYLRAGSQVRYTQIEAEPGILLGLYIPIKTGIFGQPELFDTKLIQLIFGPGVENRIFV